jgi:hypothetical protein
VTALYVALAALDAQKATAEDQTNCEGTTAGDTADGGLSNVWGGCVVEGILINKNYVKI